MDAGALERLFLRSGEKPTPAQLRQLEELVARQSHASGRGVRQRGLHYGTITNFRSGAGGGYESPVFRPSVRRAKDGLRVSWEKGTFDLEANGVREPTIGGVPISRQQARGGFPYLTVKPGDFAEGECHVYFRLRWKTGWLFDSLEPVASGPELKPFGPYVAHRLACILAPNGEVLFRALHFSQGHLALNLKPDGTAIHIYWAQ